MNRNRKLLNRLRNKTSQHRRLILIFFCEDISETSSYNGGRYCICCLIVQFGQFDYLKLCYPNGPFSEVFDSLLYFIFLMAVHLMTVYIWLKHVLILYRWFRLDCGYRDKLLKFVFKILALPYCGTVFWHLTSFTCSSCWFCALWKRRKMAVNAICCLSWLHKWKTGLAFSAGDGQRN